MIKSDSGMMIGGSELPGTEKNVGDPWSGLPNRIHALYIATRHRTGSWLAEAFATDSAVAVSLTEAIGSVAGLAKLRDEAFDVVLICHEPGELDALRLIEGYRAGGTEEAIIVLGNESEQEMYALCHEAGADGYVCVHTTTTRNLIWLVARAIQRHRLIRENYRLQLATQTQLQREHDEAQRLLAHQRGLLREMQTAEEDTQKTWRQLTEGTAPAVFSDIDRSGAEPCDEPTDESQRDESDDQLADHPFPKPLYLPDQLIGHYRELLRAYIIMGSGNLGRELTRLAEILVSAGISSQQAMEMHLHVLEELVRGLGARSTRHVMTRADLLILELMMHMTEGYRRRYQERSNPSRQLLLPGFEDFLE